MKKVFIKYNPCKLETEITVDGKKLAQNSKLGEMIESGSRLQEWIEELPYILIDEYNDRDFDIMFHGTEPDYDDLVDSFVAAYNKDELEAVIDRKPAKETSDKEVLIDEVFKEIQQGPFDELRDTDIINAFQHAKSSDFEVCVVATMSAGKSTLINAMLGTKLMPSKQEACTAIITKIKDVTASGTSWHAEVYNKDNKMIESHEELTYSTMERLNADENVSTIKINGNIPFVSSEDVSLVLIDTPGPNNSRDPEHKRVQSEFLSKSSKSLVLYIMEGTFGSDDDNTLLERVAESMNVGGKQSKDRFIFVVNKMDDRRAEDGDLESTLERIRIYLKKHGIINPNIFPAAALPALSIRMIANGKEVNEDTLYETKYKVGKLNRNEYLHLEKYASLPLSISENIDEQLKKTIKLKDENAEALIHTGVVSIEAAIRQYVQKYAKTAKIKNIVDTFMHKLDEVGCFEETKRELVKNRKESDKIVDYISNIRKNIDDVKSARKFQIAVNDAIETVNDESKIVIEDILQKFQSAIRKCIDEVRGKELDINEVNTEVTKLEKLAKNIEECLQNDLDELIRENLVNTCNALLIEYKNKLASLTEELESHSISSINIDPLKLMGGSIVEDDFLIKKLTQSKEVEDGEEWISNTSKKWYKPWTWLQEKGYYRTKYKMVKYIKADELAQEYLAPIEENVYESADSACLYASEQSNKIAKVFSQEFNHLDEVLKSKLSELESFTNDKEKTDERIKECEAKLKWLEKIKGKVESILEI